MWEDLCTPRPGIDRWAWLHGFLSGIGGLRGDGNGWAWLRRAGLPDRGGSSGL